VSGERGESGGEPVNAGEGEGASQEVERAVEELGYPLLGLLPQHFETGRCVPGMRGW
jgi:hypothetical protein